MCDVNLIYLRSGLRGQTIGAELIRTHERFWCIRLPELEQAKLFPNGVTVQASYEKSDGIYAVAATVVGTSGDLLLMLPDGTPRRRCRRSTPRYRCHLPVVIHLSSGDIEAICNDISANGMRIAVNELVSIPTRVQLSLHHPEWPLISLDAIVAWITQSDGDSPSLQFGVRLHLVDRILKEKFKQLLRDLAPNSAPPVAIRAGNNPGLHIFKAVDTPAAPETTVQLISNIR